MYFLAFEEKLPQHGEENDAKGDVSISGFGATILYPLRIRGRGL